MQKVGVDYHNPVETSNKQARGNSSDFCEVYVTAELKNWPTDDANFHWENT